MKKFTITIIMLITLLTSISCKDHKSIIQDYGENDLVPYWIHEVELSNDAQYEYLVAYVYLEDLEEFQEDSETIVVLDKIVYFQFVGSRTKSIELDYYGLPLQILDDSVFRNEKLELGDFHDFFYIYDLNSNGRNEILFPSHLGGGQLEMIILEYNSIDESFDKLLAQSFDPYYNFAIQTVDEEGKRLKVFPDYANRTREKISEGLYNQKYLIFGWDVNQRNYAEIKSGFEQTDEDDLHW